MSGIVIALGTLFVAVLEVVALAALLVVLSVVVTGVIVGIRRSRGTDTPSARLGAAGVPRQLVERRHGGRRGYGPTYVISDETSAWASIQARADEFDGHPIGERLDSDVPGCDR